MLTAVYTKRFTYPLIGFFVLLACILLFFVDPAIHSLSDYFTANVLSALVIYFLPGFILSSIVFHFFFRTEDYASRLCQALILGIGGGFALVIAGFKILA